MTPERLVGIEERRAAISSVLQEIGTAAAGAEPGTEAAKALERTMKDGQRLLGTLDRAINRAASRPLDEAPSEGRVIARISPDGGSGTEVRVVAQTWRGRHVVDFRVWRLDRASQTWVPSKRGVQLRASKLPELVRALSVATPLTAPPSGGCAQETPAQAAA